MKNSNDFDINTFLKDGKNIVIELDDEVEYILDDKAVEEIKKRKSVVNLIRVIDRTIQPTKFKKIKEAFLRDGVVDYLDKR